MNGIPETVLSLWQRMAPRLIETNERWEDYGSIKARLSMKLLANLFPYQLDSVRAIISNHGRILLADDMGLGKTIQGIFY